MSSLAEHIAELRKFWQQRQTSLYATLCQTMVEAHLSELEGLVAANNPTPSQTEADGAENGAPAQPLEDRTRSNSYAWLIEAPGQFYLRASKVGSLASFSWTNDHNAALRFYSEEQADMVMMAIRSLQPELFAFGKVLRDPKPVEHGWMGGSTDAA